MEKFITCSLYKQYLLCLFLEYTHYTCQRCLKCLLEYTELLNILYLICSSEQKKQGKGLFLSFFSLSLQFSKKKITLTLKPQKLLM